MRIAMDRRPPRIVLFGDISPGDVFRVESAIWLRTDKENICVELSGCGDTYGFLDSDEVELVEAELHIL